MAKNTKLQLPVEEVPQQVQVEPLQNIQSIEKEGTGRFEYQDGTVYLGQWKLIGENKFKHGHGHVVVASTLTQDSGVKEEYTGEWIEDKMEGQGLYKYKSGAEYNGQWKNNKHHGQGIFAFDEGCVYKGEWCEHKMHGEGVFTDKEGNIWEGEFVSGCYQSKMQKQLKMEKMMKKKEQEIKENSLSFFPKFSEAFLKSDKKTMKENLIPSFATSEEIKLYVKDPYPKYEDRLPEKWADAIKYLSEYTSINVPRQNTQARIVDPIIILAAQFSGIGQIVEIIREQAPRIVKLVLCNAFENSWVMIFFHDNQEPEIVQGKKK